MASIKDFYPNKPSGTIVKPNGSYCSTRALSDTPFTCPECDAFAWTLHEWDPYIRIGVCSGCFGKVKDQGRLTKRN